MRFYCLHFKHISNFTASIAITIDGLGETGAYLSWLQARGRAHPGQIDKVSQG